MGTRPTAMLDKHELMTLIVGRELNEIFPGRGAVPTGHPLVSVRGLSAGRVRNISFDLLPGEVLGLAGLVGAGRTEVLGMLSARTHVRPARSRSTARLCISAAPTTQSTAAWPFCRRPSESRRRRSALRRRKRDHYRACDAFRSGALSCDRKPNVVPSRST